jgi:signal transduction histidine kinase
VKKPVTIAALVIWGIGIGLATAGIVLLLLNRSFWGSPLAMFNDAFSLAVTALAYTSVGAFLFARFPRNPLTWIICGIGVMTADAFFTTEYVLHAQVVASGSLPAAALVTWLSFPTILVSPFALAMFLLLFPNGRPQSRRWKAVIYADIALEAVVLIYSAVPSQMSRPAGLQNVDLNLNWPAFLAPLAAIGVTDAWKTAFQIAQLAQLGLGLSVVAGALGLLWRLRRAKGAERQQLKWLTYAAAAMTLGFVAFGSDRLWAQDFSRPEGLTISSVGLVIGVSFVTFGIPAATLIAITKYRLYDIDLVINKTLVYGFLALVITAVYALLVVYIGAMVGGPERFGLSLVATALIAIAFQPLRIRTQRLANRLVYGKRATPYEALSQLNAQIAETYGGEEILERMTRILAEATGAERAELWVKRGDQMVRTVAWPVAGEATGPISDGRLLDIGGDKVLPVAHQGTLLGALAITKKRGETLSQLEEKLLSDLASQAGLVLENVGLNRELLARLDDLQASRQRLVTAQDEERRRIERNLHDGAQQQVVALTVQLGLLDRMLSKDPDKARAMAAGIRQSAIDALETLRELAHGIYPPLLASDGLATALRQHVRRSLIPVDFDMGDVPRQPKEVEAAVYFCCLEALQNIGKHAQATKVVIRLRVNGGQLNFQVSDNGRGFKPGEATVSAGLQNMRDRIQAVGGSLNVRSEPGTGSTVAGSVPLAPTSSELGSARSVGAIGAPVS